ncbi:MAG: hypothetical protein AAGI88_17615 [Pseudomonadota bacterium]
MTQRQFLAYHRLRCTAAVIATVSGLFQCSTLWIFPVTPALLLAALAGSLYVLLGLGLFGVSRFSLALAIAVPASRCWMGWFPIEIGLWDTMRDLTDIVISLICLPLFWKSLDPNFRNETRASSRQHSGKHTHRGIDA